MRPRAAGTVPGVPEIAFIKGAPDLAHTLQAFGADVGPQFDPLPTWLADPTKIASADKTHATQRWWAEASHVARRARLPEGATLRDQCPDAKWAARWN